MHLPALSGRGWRCNGKRCDECCIALLQVVVLLRDSLPYLYSYSTTSFPARLQVVTLLCNALAAAGLELYLVPHGVLPTDYECCVGYLT